MAQLLKIKRSSTTTAPGSLAQGEIAYSSKAGSQKLFIGEPGTGNVLTIGGKVFVDMLDHTAGTLTANSAILVDSNKKINELLTSSITIGTSNAYTLPTADGNSGQALISNGSGAVAFADIASSLTTAGNSGTGTIAQLTQSLTVSGSGPISTVASNQAIAISISDATTSAKGIASFDSTDFTVSSGAVSVAATTIGSTAVNPGTTTTAIAGLTQINVDNIQVDGNTLSTTNSNGSLLITPNGTGVVNVPAGYKDRSGFSSNALATKEYVDSFLSGLDIKQSVRVATVAALTAVTYNNGSSGVGATLTANQTGALTVDGVSVLLNNRVLVKDQASGLQNGIYTLTTVGTGSGAYILTRAANADTAAELTGGVFCFVEEGATVADNGFVFTHNGTPTIGTTNLTVTQFTGVGQLIAGAGLTKSTNTINVIGSPTISVNADSTQIKGVSTTAVGDLLIGVASDAGYGRLVKPSGNATASDYLLTMNTSGVASWANIIDGGTYS